MEAGGGGGSGFLMEKNLKYRQLDGRLEDGAGATGPAEDRRSLRESI